jgi:urea transporter
MNEDIARLEAYMSHPAMQAIALIRAAENNDIDRMQWITDETDPFLLGSWFAQLVVGAFESRHESLNEFLDHATSQLISNWDKFKWPPELQEGGTPD